MAGIAPEFRDRGEPLLPRYDLVRPGQEACPAGSFIVLADVDSCQVQFRASGNQDYASSSSALDRTDIL